MKRWLFTFTQADRELSYAEVAARSRAEACGIISDLLDRPLVAMPFGHPEAGTILAAFGAVDVVAPQLLKVTMADGTVRVPA